jgi:hypothetical protein
LRRCRNGDTVPEEAEVAAGVSRLDVFMAFGDGLDALADFLVISAEQREVDRSHGVFAVSGADTHVRHVVTVGHVPAAGKAAEHVDRSLEGWVIDGEAALLCQDEPLEADQASGIDGAVSTWYAVAPRAALGLDAPDAAGEILKARQDVAVAGGEVILGQEDRIVAPRPTHHAGQAGVIHDPVGGPARVVEVAGVAA